MSHGVENYISRLWGTGISDAFFNNSLISDSVRSMDTKHGKVFSPTPSCYISYVAATL